MIILSVFLMDVSSETFYICTMTDIADILGIGIVIQYEFMQTGEKLLG